MESAQVQRGECCSSTGYKLLASELIVDSLQNLICSVQRLTPSSIEFDLVGVDASIANALRRVMIAEVSYKLCK